MDFWDDDFELEDFALIGGLIGAVEEELEEERKKNREEDDSLDEDENDDEQEDLSQKRYDRPYHFLIGIAIGCRLKIMDTKVYND
jgi:hypothetical protein